MKHLTPWINITIDQNKEIKAFLIFILSILFITWICLAKLIELLWTLGAIIF